MIQYALYDLGSSITSFCRIKSGVQSLMQLDYKYLDRASNVHTKS